MSILTGFTVASKKMHERKIPLEDSFRYTSKSSRRIIAVADGIPRDITLEKLPDGEFLDWGHLMYPRPSPSREVADIFTYTAVDHCEILSLVSISQQTIDDAFEFINNRISDYNRETNPQYPDVDYLINDFYSTVGALAVIDGNMAYYGWINDCGVAVFNKEGVITQRTPDEMKESKVIRKRRMDSVGLRSDWKLPESRYIKRAVFRNRVGMTGAFGELTGEPEALEFVRTESSKLNSLDSVILYTDGLADLLETEEVKKLIKNRDSKGLEQYCAENVKTEGTLVWDI